MVATNQRELMAGRRRDDYAKTREIGSLPAVVNPSRKARAIASLRLFLETYFPRTFTLGWSTDHLKTIAKIEQAIENGGMFALGMPRGSGKTQIFVRASLWAIMTGRRRYALNISSDEGQAGRANQIIKSELEHNELLAEDFPEVCFPIRKLEGIAQRAKGQLLNGLPTSVSWTDKLIVLPTVPGSQASGAAVSVAGITGQIRGVYFTTPSGDTVRPDLVLIDDPQTDESANSPSQCVSRIRTIDGAILGVGGPNVKITAVMACTVIREGDLADTYLDRKQKPAWRGEKFKLVYSMPTDMAAWKKYAAIRTAELVDDDDPTTPKALAYYLKNRRKMDAGSVVAWEERKNDQDVSAIQHAMNIFFDNEEAFFAEYQNEPKPPATHKSKLNAEDLSERLNGIKHKIIPDDSTRMTAFIDIQGNVLYYVVCAWQENFTGAVVDYGTWPKQAEKYYQKRTMKKTMQRVLKLKDLEGCIWGSLESLVNELAGEWKREDGSPTKIDRILIDGNWGQSTDTVYKFCRRSPHSSILMPSHGRFIRAKSRDFWTFRPKPGDRVGPQWKIPKPGPRQIRHCAWNGNHWKTYVADKLSIPIGQSSAITFYGDDAGEHKLFIDHLLSEYATRVEVEGNVVEEWDIKPERMDNDLWDGLVGCTVGASTLGVETLGDRVKTKNPKREKKKFSEMKRERMQRAGV